MGTCKMAKVNARVTDTVICVFHASVTFPPRRRRWKLFDVVVSSTIKEASKTEKVRKNFNPSEKSHDGSELPVTALYLSKEHPDGKK